MLTKPQVTATAVSSTEVGLVWTDAGTESKYRVRYSKDGNNWITLAEVGATIHEYLHAQLAPSTRYWYRVIALNRRGGTAASDIVAVTTTGEAPPAPETCDGVLITDGGDLQAAIDRNGPGTTFCLDDILIPAAIRPRSKDRFVARGSEFAQLRPAGSTTFAFDLKASNATDVELVGLDVGYFADNGVNGWIGLKVSHGRYHHCFSNGIGAGFERQGGATLTDVEIDNNGDVTLLGNSAGGVKFARIGTDGTRTERCHIHDNIGNGHWADVQCLNYDVIGCSVHGNTRKGIHYEKSGGTDELGAPEEGMATITDNEVYDNGGEHREHSADGGITAVSSKHMRILRNKTWGNWHAGVRIIQDSRLSGDKHGWKVSDITIDGEHVDGIDGCDLAGVTCS